VTRLLRDFIRRAATHHPMVDRPQSAGKPEMGLPAQSAQLTSVDAHLFDLRKYSMNKSIALGTLALALSAPAWANLALAQKNACSSCHAVERKLLGPSYVDIAKRYTDQADAEATLAKSIKAGGAGKWGPVPMPAQPAVSEADAKTLAAWILSGAK